MATMKRKKTFELPPELVHEILVRLPVKTLCQFRLVSKSWNSLISHPLFQKDHYRRRSLHLLAITKPRIVGIKLKISTYNNSGELSTNSSRRVSEELDCYTAFHPIQICRGFICIATRFKSILLYNPSTKERIVVPPTQGYNECIGFGYSNSTKEFKVVKFFYCRDSKRNCCKVFSSGAGVWRDGRNNPSPIRICCGSAVFLNGALHFLRDKRNRGSVTAFDFETEEYRQIPVPKNDSTKLVNLMELGRALCLVNKRDVLCKELWVLKDYKSREWVKEYTIDLSTENLDIYNFNVLAISGDGGFWLSVRGPRGRELMCYNLGAKIVTKRIHTGRYGGLYFESFPDSA